MSVVKADVDPGLGPDLNCAIDRATSGSAGRPPREWEPMLEKETSPRPIPAPPSRIPRPWQGDPPWVCPKSPPAENAHLPLPPSPGLWVHSSSTFRGSPPQLPRGDPFIGQYNSRFSADRQQHPLLHPCFWKQISPVSCREKAWPASFSNTAPSPPARLGSL